VIKEVYECRRARVLKVKVQLIQEFYLLVGKPVLEFEVPENATVFDVIELLPRELKERVIDEKGNVKYPVEIAVNGRRIDFLDGLNTKLKDGDVILLSPRALFVV
jgi:molybdopterin synthase sulfur carrier subunit